ncbi:MAG: hypothetical protein KF685_12870 [Acidobacteria bacterium]|nr:hypothetical protein [Acidobacteriota bacterium]
MSNVSKSIGRASNCAVLLIILGVLLGTACQSEVSEPNVANTANSNQISASNTEVSSTNISPQANVVDTANLAANAANANLTPQEIAEVPPPAEGGPTPISLTEAKKRRLEHFRSGEGTGLPPDMNVDAGPQVQPAPDNSEYFITLTDVARETRRFKSHSLLDKVEKESDGKNVKITVFLKNGKQVNIEPKRISNFAQATAAQFLNAAGVK